MSLPQQTALKRAGYLAFLSLLVSACANMEPGMRIDTEKVPSTNAQPQQTPVIKPITPDLVQEVRAEKARLVDERVKNLFGTPQAYLIGSGDLLSILVWDHPELNIAAAGAQALSSSGAQSPAAFVVDQQGMIQFPYVGAIKLAGLTELQARNLLAEKLIKSIKRPDITLRVLAFRSKKIYVDGEVKAPGNQAIDDVPMTLLEGVTRAGGFLPTSDQSQITVARGGVSYPVNLPMLVKQGVDLGRLMLAPGDVVRVPSREENKVFVLGEVNAPKALPMNNGSLTLAQALGEAGGLNQLSASSRQVYVIRNANQKEPLVFNLDAGSPVALAMAEQFELNPRDVVFVDASGLARYNRIISLILPTAATAATSYGQIK
jgi:polysaccharide export outer membrane protein